MKLFELLTLSEKLFALHQKMIFKSRTKTPQPISGSLIAVVKNELLQQEPVSESF